MSLTVQSIAMCGLVCTTPQLSNSRNSKLRNSTRLRFPCSGASHRLHLPLCTSRSCTPSALAVPPSARWLHSYGSIEGLSDVDASWEELFIDEAQAFLQHFSVAPIPLHRHAGDGPQSSRQQAPSDTQEEELPCATQVLGSAARP